MKLPVPSRRAITLAVALVALAIVASWWKDATLRSAVLSALESNDDASRAAAPAALSNAGWQADADLRRDVIGVLAKGKRDLGARSIAEVLHSLPHQSLSPDLAGAVAGLV